MVEQSFCLILDDAKLAFIAVRSSFDAIVLLDVKCYVGIYSYIRVCIILSLTYKCSLE